MTLYLLRHAEKEKGDYFNPALRHQDPPLSRRGEAQSENLVPFFKSRGIDSIYVSSYLRTRQTAEPLAKYLHLSPAVDPHLDEIDNGILECLDNETIARQYPQVWRAYTERTHDFRFPQGKTGGEAQARIVAFIAQMSAQSKNILAVSHDGLIRALFCHVTGTPVYKRFDYRVDLCGLMEIEYIVGEAKWRLVRFNQAIGERDG